MFTRPLLSPSSPLLLATLLTLFMGCKSAPSEKVDLMPEEDDTAMLEQGGRRITEEDRSLAGDEDVFIPLANDTPSLAIDGQADDWEAKSLRRFSGKEYVIDGRKAWKGSKDASLSIGARSDGSFIYFLIEATDDRVIAERGEQGLARDAIKLWLRDPKLEQFQRNLPRGIEVEDELVGEIALEILPDGSVESSPRLDATSKNALQISTFTNSSGWGAEIAVAAEIFPHMATFPSSEVAFRVELLDGDDPKRDDHQSHLSMFPGELRDTPRFALMEIEGGWLPHGSASGAIGRADGVGYWRREGAGWQYVSMEVRPRSWRVLSDSDTLLQVADSASLACPSRDQERVALEAYESRTGRHRVGLLLCTTNEERGKCPDDAKTELFWLHTARGASEGEPYELKRKLSVFRKPLPQCRSRAADGEELRDNFSLLPLDVIDANAWAVGWRAHMEGDEVSTLRHAMLLLSTKTGESVGEHTLYSRVDEGATRVETRTASYLVDVDEVEGYDVCELETRSEQNCREYQQGCEAREHGTSVVSYVKLWQPGPGRFEAYDLARHSGCPYDLNLSEREGYMVIHTGTRLGLLPSNLNKP